MSARADASAQRTPDAVIRRIRRLRYQQRWSREAIGQHLGVSASTVHKYAPTPIIRKGRVTNEPLREAFLATGWTAVELCARLGWDDPSPGTHVSRARRALGLRSWQGHWASSIGEEHAKQMCRALDVEFYDLYPELEPAPAAHCHCGEPMIWAADECGFCEAERMLACA